jgi:DNA-directed RNA polymerase specialized sigma24 family protein
MGRDSPGGVAFPPARRGAARRPPPQDRALVEALRLGEAGAVTTFAEQYGGRIHRFLVSLLPDPRHAERVTQDVLSRVVRDIHGYAGSPVFLSWVYRIALEAAREYAPVPRRRTRARARPAGGPRTGDPAPRPAGPA